jgi:hypothetical protein
MVGDVRLVRGIVVGAWIAACGHADRLVIDDPEGPAPGRIARAEDLRRDLRAQARELRRQPSGRFDLLPSGLPDIQRAFPERDELVDRARVRGSDVAGLVKAHGDHLVLLRGDRLVVVAVGEAMRLVADEPLGDGYRAALLVDGDEVVVVLPRISRGGEVSGVVLRRFTIAADGRLTRRRSTHLRGRLDDIPDARLVGGALVLHVQSALGQRVASALGLPKIWRAGRWQPLIRATELQRPVVRTTRAQLLVRCALGREMSCTTSGVVAPSAVYVQHDDEATVVWTRRHVWRLPVDGSPATVVRVVGRPLDLLAWRLDRGDVDAVVTNDDAVGLLRIPGAMLRAGLYTLTAADLRPLAPTLRSEFATRFVGDRLLYADNADWACHGDTTLRVRSLGSGDETTLVVPHCVGRIEPAGAHALAIAAPHNDPRAPVRLTAIDLTATPALGDTREYPGVHPGYLRATGPYRLGGSLRGMSPGISGPVRIFAQDGPRLRDVGSAPAGDWRDHAFAYAGRIYVAHERGLVELEHRDGVVRERRRIALPLAR